MGQNASSTTSRPIQAGDYAFSLYVTIGYWILAASSFNDIFVAIDGMFWKKMCVVLCENAR